MLMLRVCSNPKLNKNVKCIVYFVVLDLEIIVKMFNSVNLILGGGSILVGLCLYGSWRRYTLPPGPDRLCWGGTVFGHRGCRFVENIPENTIPAFEYGYKHGCGGIECDVRLTSDGHVVVFHDLLVGNQLHGLPSFKRVDEVTLEELKMATYAEDSTKMIRVPTLEEVIVFAKERKMRILIEIKEVKRVDLCLKKILELYDKYNSFLYENSTIISFNPKAVYGVRVLDPRIAVGQLFSPTLFRTWDKLRNGPLPWYIDKFPLIWDLFAQFILGEVYPRLAGCSLICPKYVVYDNKYHKKWITNNRTPIGIYLWGFENSAACTPVMRKNGVCVSGDDKHEEFIFPE